MANGGGPACLRLRVVADPADVDPRFLMTGETLDRVEAIVERLWPERIAPDDLTSDALAADVETARRTVAEALQLTMIL